MQAANEQLARTTAYLEEEKARAEALLYRMSNLIACFPCGPGENPQQLAEMAECQSQAAQLVGGPANNSGSFGSSKPSSDTRHTSALGEPLLDRDVRLWGPVAVRWTGFLLGLMRLGLCVRLNAAATEADIGRWKC